VPRSILTGSLSEIRECAKSLKALEKLIAQQLVNPEGAADLAVVQPTCEDTVTCSGTTKTELERQFAEVRSQVQKAQRAEALLLSALRQHPPVSKVSSDILIRIFEEGLQLDDSIWDNHLWFSDENRGEIPSILVASHVNRRWRDTALSSTSLWGNLKITSTQSLRYLDMFLGRFGASPLDIRIRGGKSWDDVKSRIIPLTDRWRSFSGSSFSAIDVDRMVYSLRSLSVPQLEDLRIQSYDQFMRVTRGPTTTMLVLNGGAPKLSSLYLVDVSLHSCYPSLTALKSLDLYMYRPGLALDLDDMRKVLTASPSLTTLKIASAVLGSVNGREDLPPISLPSLRSLELSFDINCCPDRLICIFVALSAPKLESLVINLAPSPNIERIICAVNALRTPKDYSNLSTLMFWDVDCAEWIGPKFIRVLPAVTFLTLVRSAEDTVLEILLEKDTDPTTPLWPELRTLKLSVFNINLLCEFITRRIGAEHPIQKLIIVHDLAAPKIPQERIGWLRERLEIHEMYPPTQ
jgi:hypothetical protein